jgi:hypothetical protein
MTQEEKDIIVSASNVIYFLSQITHGIAAGKRKDLIFKDFLNANDHYQFLERRINKYNKSK